MRIARLIATGDNRTGRHAARAQDRRINFGAEDFGSQRFAVPAQSFSGAWLGRFQNFDGAFESFFGDSQRLAHHFHFLLRFRLALRPEKPVCRADTDFVGGKLLGVTESKICRDKHRSYASLFKKMRQNFFIGRRLFGFSLHFALDLAEHDEFICVGLLATAIDFQIAKDKRAFAIAFEKDEWIGRPKLCRIEHVGIRVAGGDDEAGWFCFCFAHSPCYAAWHCRATASVAKSRDGRRSARRTHEIQLLRTSSSLRKIQCNSPSKPSVDRIRTAVLKKNTPSFIPK